MNESMFFFIQNMFQTVQSFNSMENRLLFLMRALQYRIISIIDSEIICFLFFLKQGDHSLRREEMILVAIS